jgi:hypothetical protein
MSPPTWATPEQINFLQPKIPEYREHKAKHLGPRFLSQIAHQFWEKWPEAVVLWGNTGKPPSVMSEDTDVSHIPFKA